jgi:sterol desaturase/sphingolipid hydroxylase (fatty acid hydroxylase superfamily)
VIIVAVVLGSLLLVAVAELGRARRRRRFPALRRCVGNLAIWLLNLFLATFFLPPPQALRPHLAGLLGSGLPAWPIGNAAVGFVAGFLLLDLLHYAVHRWQHAAPFLWRFHALHHSDPDVDVTTSVRHHPIEYLIAAAIYWLAVLALDMPAAIVLSHALAVFAAASVTHGNTRLPQWAERRLQPVVITLDLHLVHHSMAYEEANANFGAVLSIWDRMFGTFVRLPQERQERLVFGVSELPPRDCLTMSAMMLTPWRLSSLPAPAPAPARADGGGGS